MQWHNTVGKKKEEKKKLPRCCARVCVCVRTRRRMEEDVWTAASLSSQFAMLDHIISSWGFGGQPQAESTSCKVVLSRQPSLKETQTSLVTLQNDPSSQSSERRQTRRLPLIWQMCYSWSSGAWLCVWFKGGWSVAWLHHGFVPIGWLPSCWHLNSDRRPLSHLFTLPPCFLFFLLLLS